MSASSAVLTTSGANRPVYSSEARAQSASAGSRIPIPTAPSGTPASLLPSHQVSPLSVSESDQWIQLLFGFAKRSSSTPNPISSGASGTQDSMGDASYLIRSIAPLVGPDSPVYQAVGITSGENTFQGSNAAYKANKRREAAIQIGDVVGEIGATLDTARGIAQGIGGAFYLGYRGTMIASEVTHVTASKGAATALGRTAFRLGWLGNLFFSGFYALMGAASGYHLYRSEKLFRQINERTEVDDLARFLLSKAHGDVHARVEKLRNVCEETCEYEKKQLEESCTEALAEQLSRGGSKFKKTSLKDVVRALFKELDKDPQLKAEYLRIYCESLGLDPAEIEGLDLSPLQLCGLKVEEDHRNLRKEARLGRVIGSKAMQEIQAAYRKGLAERLLSEDLEIRDAARIEAEGLEKIVRSELVKNRVIYGALIACSIVGLFVSIAGLFTLAPGMILGMTIVNIVLAIAFSALDLYFWKNALDSEAPGKYDKAFVSVAMGILLASLAGSICLTFVLGFPILPFILATTIVVIGVAISIYTLYTIHQREVTWKEEHPDLEYMEQQMNGPLDERTGALFKKLSRSDRQAIRKAIHQPYLTTANAPGYQVANDPHHRYIEQVINRQAAQIVAADPARNAGEASADLQLLERAAKKTSKEFWAKWHHTRKEVDREKALKMVALVQALQMQREQIEDGAPWISAGFDAERRETQRLMRDIQADGELYNTFKADIHYLKVRKGDGAQLQGMMRTVRQEAAAAATSVPEPVLSDDEKERIKQIWLKTF